jgi:hypothetical protein
LAASPVRKTRRTQGLFCCFGVLFLHHFYSDKMASKVENKKIALAWPYRKIYNCLKVESKMFINPNQLKSRNGYILVQAFEELIQK